MEGECRERTPSLLRDPNNSFQSSHNNEIYPDKQKQVDAPSMLPIAQLQLGRLLCTSARIDYDIEEKRA